MGQRNGCTFFKRSTFVSGDFTFGQEPTSLHTPHSGVMAIAPEQLGMSSILDNFPAIENNNAVQVGNRR